MNRSEMEVDGNGSEIGVFVIARIIAHHVHDHRVIGMCIACNQGGKT